MEKNVALALLGQRMAESGLLMMQYSVSSLPPVLPPLQRDGGMSKKPGHPGHPGRYPPGWPPPPWPLRGRPNAIGGAAMTASDREHGHAA